MSEKKMVYKYCLVPDCPNTSKNVSDKLFINVPYDIKTRKVWQKAMRRDVFVSNKSHVHCCKAHFKDKLVYSIQRVINSTHDTFKIVNMSYFKGSTTQPLSDKTIGDLVEEANTKYRDNVFIISRHEKRNVTFGELIEDADNLALGLIKIGLNVGDKVGIIVNTSIEAFVVNIACIRGGFVLVNLNPALQHRELEYCINFIKINCVITLEKYRNFSVLNVFQKLIPENKFNDSGSIDSENVPSLKYLVVISDTKHKGAFHYGTLKASGKNMPRDHITNNQSKINSENLLTILFTSGSTGNPKAAGLTHFQLGNCSKYLATRMDLYNQQYKFCFYLPLFHLFGILVKLLSVISGHPLVLPAYYYNPEENLKAIEEEKCNYLMGTPTMFNDLIIVQKELNRPISPLVGISGGALCYEKTLKEMKEVLNIKNIGAAYGSTETLVVTWSSFYDNLGDVMDHLELKVCDSDGNIVPLGTVGELSVKGYSVINGYWSEVPSSTQTNGCDGWFRTGDLFLMDKDKKLHIAGRIKDIINRGGEKISPGEVEDVLENYPPIAEICVIGTHHERLGEEVCACIKLKPEATVTLREIKDYCKEKLSYYKIPTRLEIIDSIPKTNLGKIQRLLMLEQINKITATRNG